MTREEFEQLLPWYATGALDTHEAQAVESYLEESAEARAELESFRALHAVVQDTSGEPEWNPGLVNDALARIDAYERERSEAPASGGVLGWLRRTFVPTWEGTPSLARAALVAQLALMLALGGALFASQRGEPGFETVGGSERPVAGDGALLSLGFADAVSEADVRALMKEIDGEIVAGPSALGLYRVAVPVERAEADALIDRLGSDRRVRYVERVP